MQLATQKERKKSFCKKVFQHFLRMNASTYVNTFMGIFCKMYVYKNGFFVVYCLIGLTSFYSFKKCVTSERNLDKI